VECNKKDDMKKGTYDLKAFRTVRHGESDKSAHCRMCKESRYDGDVQGWVRDHARKTLHTVDFYRENHTEYTCHIKAI
jgi:hypothetical protein